MTVLLLSWLGVNLQGQVDLDSLRSIYESSDGDSLRYEMLRVYEKEVRRGDRVAALPLMKERVRLAEKSKNDDWIAKSLTTLGNNYMFLSKNDSAQIYLDRSVVVSKRLESPSILYANYNSLALILQRSNKYEEAIGIYHQIITVSDSLGDIVKETSGYSNLAALLMDQGDYERALPYLHEVEENYQSLNDDSEGKDKLESFLTGTYTNFGQCYQHMDSLELAEVYFVRARRYLDFVGDDYSKIYYSSFIESNVSDIEIEKCFKSQRCSRSKWGDLVSAARSAYDGFSKIEYDRGRCAALVSVGAGLTGQGQYKAANDTLLRAIQLGRQLQFKEELAKSYIHLSRNAELSGDYKSSIAYYRQGRLLNDSIRNEERDKQFAQQEVRYQTAEKEREITELALENERKSRQQIQQLFGYVMATLLLLGGGYIFYSRYKLRKQRELSKFQETTNTAMARFVPTAFIKALGRDEITDVELGDQVEKEVTVMFSDIRDFTTISESMTPKENFAFVMEYAGRMGPIIEKYGGFVNQYMGDGIMAIFQDGVNPALDACIAMQKDIVEYNRVLEGRGQKPIRVGMGLHKGPLIMGIIGDEVRRDATLISDAVNTAARIESTTKIYDHDILLSGEVEEELNEKSRYKLERKGDVSVKGKNQQVEIYALLT